LNGSKIHTENTRRTCEADQVLLNVKLKAGKNHLLVKCCNLDQEHQVYFASGLSAFKGIGWFVDASEEFGLGESGLGAETKSDGLIVADLDHDGKLDVLLAAETPLLLTLRGQRFTAITDHNLRFVSARFGPILGDYDQDGLLDLFVPAGTAGHTLLRNKGKFQFEEVPLTALGLSQPLGHVTSAAWGDINNDGKLDLLVTLLRGTNRAFQNNGNGTFTDISDRLGINQKIHNTQAACWADLNKDGALDLVLNNEGQDSVVYFGVAKPAKLTPVLLKGTVSAREVTILNQQGQRLTSSQVGTTEGRGAQSGLNPRFVLVPGQYRLQIISQDGKAREKPFTVEASPLLLDPSP
jgi:hypothetical protein